LFEDFILRGRRPILLIWIKASPEKIPPRRLEYFLSRIVPLTRFTSIRPPLRPEDDIAMLQTSVAAFRRSFFGRANGRVRDAAVPS